MKSKFDQVIFAIVGTIFRTGSPYPAAIFVFALAMWAGSRMLREGIESIKSLLGLNKQEDPPAVDASDDDKAE
jgi:hypothetical protein